MAMTRDGAAYQPEQWHDLAIALAGASAALTGLLFVAVSINLSRILATRTLTIRAVETLLMLVSLLLLALLILVPGQPVTALGAEIVVLGLLGLSPLIGRLRQRDAHRNGGWRAAYPIVVTVAAAVPLLVAGLSLISGRGGGLYWLGAAIVLSLCGAVVNAWVLLVEILR